MRLKSLPRHFCWGRGCARRERCPAPLFSRRWRKEAGERPFLGTGRQRALSPALLIYFSLSVARYRRHASAVAAPLALLPAPGSAAGRRGRLWSRDGSGRRTRPLRPQLQTHGCCLSSLQGLGERLRLFNLHWRLLRGSFSPSCFGSPGPTRWPRVVRVRSGAPTERVELSTFPPKGLGTVARPVPTRSRALLVIASVLEGEPAPPCLPPPVSVPRGRRRSRCSPFSAPRHQPGLKPLRRRGEETGERNSSSPGKQKPCVHQTAFGSPAQAAAA